MERRKSGEETDALARMHILAETLRHVCRILLLCFFPCAASASDLCFIPFAIPLPSHPIHLVSILPRLRAPPPCPALPCPAPSCPVLCRGFANQRACSLLSCSPLRRRPLHPRCRSSSSPSLPPSIQQPSPSSFLFLLLLYPQPQHPAQVRQTDRPKCLGSPRRQKE